MIEQLVIWLKGLPPELTTVIISALPVTELRGGIVAGHALGLGATKVFLLAVVGNLLPVIPLLLLLEPVSKYFRHLPFADRFFDWLFARTARKAGLIEKYEAIGLALFVAVPLPMTGMWTGAVAASIFKIPLKYSLPAIVAGVVMAGVVVSVLCETGKLIIQMH